MFTCQRESSLQVPQKPSAFHRHARETLSIVAMRICNPDLSLLPRESSPTFAMTAEQRCRYGYHDHHRDDEQCPFYCKHTKNEPMMARICDCNSKAFSRERILLACESSIIGC
jgi:hypothetical protein